MEFPTEDIYPDTDSIPRGTPKTHRIARPPPARLLLMNTNDISSNFAEDNADNSNSANKTEARLRLDEEEPFYNPQHIEESMSKTFEYECEYELSVTPVSPVSPLMQTPESFPYINVLSSPTITTAYPPLVNEESGQMPVEEEEFNINQYLENYHNSFIGNVSSAVFNNAVNITDAHHNEQNDFTDDEDEDSYESDNKVELLVSFNPLLQFRYIPKEELFDFKHTQLEDEDAKIKQHNVRLPEISVKIIVNNEDKIPATNKNKESTFYKDISQTKLSAKSSAGPAHQQKSTKSKKLTTPTDEQEYVLVKNRYLNEKSSQTHLNQAWVMHKIN